MLKPQEKENILHNQFYFYTLVEQVGFNIIQLFYYVALFKQLNDIKVIIIDHIIFFAGLWIGYIIGSFLIQRIGYGQSFRFALILLSLVSLLLFLSYDRLLEFYVIIALLRGFARGFYWPIYHSYIMRDFKVTSRNYVISMLSSFYFVIDVILPVSIGYLLNLTGDYKLLYLISFFILFISQFAKWEYNKFPKTNISSQEVINILRKPKIGKYLLLNFFYAGTDVINYVILGIIPFIIFRNEFSVGILASVVNLAAAVFIFRSRNKNVDKEYRIAKFGYLINFIAIGIFILNWNAIGLSIAALLFVFANGMRKPHFEKLDTAIRNKILGESIRRSSIEMNMVVSTVFFLSRMIFLPLFLFLFLYIKSLDFIFQFFIIVGGVWNFIHIYFLQKFNKEFKHHE